MRISARLHGIVLSLALVALGGAGASAEDSGVVPTTGPATMDQVMLLVFADQGRSVGYQSMLSGIHLETIKAQLDRDAAILERNRALYERNAVSLLELEVSQLKDAWNKLQLQVAERNLTAVAAQVTAISMLNEHFAGTPVDLGDLYAVYLRGWDAGCDKGPIEARANEAWMAYAEKSLERARQLQARGSLSEEIVLAREADLRIATVNFERRFERLDRCREVFFPSFDDVAKAGR
ncbi:hypothetical protein PVW48_17805 [Dinoroseobacter sp. PD6]|uniref:hypothetical protein n=1 Tax=Dinoroseobacter sp. PD6 TaxID=3028384 RepID=UPI00237B7A00|nr:hypothetical protein [Dinoroseobacter sp. PD6]MDD9718622.1 hypothetical protein [Dinoroseobacter sp. PD6]